MFTDGNEKQPIKAPIQIIPASEKVMTTDNDLQNVASEYHRQSAALQTIRLLNQLIRSIQRHRGVSLALLAGDGVFIEDIGELQGQIERRISSLPVLCKDYNSMTTAFEQENIRQNWVTISNDWENDALLENFEFHSHFVEQLIQMINRLSECLETPLCASEHGESQQASLLKLVCRRAPEMIEYVARIRGLATHAAVISECYESHRQKLRYWIQFGRKLNAEIVTHLETYSPSTRLEMGAMGQMKSYEFKLLLFLNTLERDVLAPKTIDTDANMIFRMGSEIIDAYVEAVKDGTRYLQEQLDRDLEHWLAGS